MNRKSLILGGVLIFMGASMFLKNFHIAPADTLLLLLGIYFLYSYKNKQQQGHIVIGGIAITVSLMSIMSHINIFNFDISGGLFFIMLGASFIYLYNIRGIKGFIFPGCILPSLGIYSILMDNLSSKYAWPSIFLLLAVSFFVIYFIEYMNSESWPIIVGVILFIIGVIFYASSFGFLNIELNLIRKMIMPLMLIGTGAILIIRVLKKEI